MTQNIFQTGMDVASGLEGLRRNQQSQNIVANQEMRVQDETAYQTGQREASAQAGQALSALKQQYADSGDPAIMPRLLWLILNLHQAYRSSLVLSMTTHATKH